MLLSLPSELILIIATYLSKYDYYQLICVNYACHDLFLPLLYHTMHVSTDTHIELILNTPACHPYVRKLDGYGSTFSRDIVSRIVKTFPLLQSFHVRHMRLDNPLGFYQSFKHLISIHLILGGGSIILEQVLSVTPHLRSLHVVVRDFLGPQSDLFNPIHRLCPQLEHLSVRGNNTEGYNQLLKEQSVVPHLFLKSLELQVSSGQNPASSWLVFLGNAYPNLTRLRLDYLMLNINERCPASFYDCFLSKCSHLTHFEWINVLPDRTFLEKLSQHQLKSQEIVIVETDLLKLYCDGSGSLFHGLLNLSLALPKRKAPESFVALIGKACPRLRKLTLFGSSSMNNSSLDINVALDSCQHLALLRVSMIRLHVEKREIERHRQDHLSSPHQLERLYIESSSFDQESLEYIALRCPYLKHLTIAKSKQVDTRYQIKLHLPNHQLRELYVSELQNSHVLNRDTIQLFHVKQGERADWYLIDKAKLSSCYTAFKRATSFKTLTKQELEVLNTLLEGDPAVWPESLSRSLTTLVFENRVVADFLPPGYVSISLKSIDALYINGARAYGKSSLEKQ